jgi:hypothetical protein
MLSHDEATCHCSYERKNSHAIGEHSHMFSYILLELGHFFFRTNDMAGVASWTSFESQESRLYLSAKRTVATPLNP